MKKKLATWRLVRSSLNHNIPVMLLYVLQSSGSSPGRQGFFMAVDIHGNMEGSIGGGMMELKLVELAKERLQRGERQPLVKRQIHNKESAKDQSGMICSGEQTVFLYPVQQTDEAQVRQIISSLEKNEGGEMVLSPDGLAFEQTPSPITALQYEDEHHWNYRERLAYQRHLSIIGGGHCALALSGLMSTMDFYIHLFEDREDLFTLKRNEAVHRKTVVEDYSELSNLIPDGEYSYVVIMTFGYRTDDLALRALLNKEVKYLGLMGSEAKIQQMLDRLRCEGVQEDLLRRIHAPIGLPIKSETPEEIAVSIAAEMIQVKNRRS